jgi:site-specific DNA recombinase
VIVWHTDRLHRSPRELEEYVDLCERKKITTQTVKAGELDLATPSGRAIARTLGAWARFEVEHKSERTKRAQLQAAQAGKWLGGSPPIGWNVRPDGSATLDRAAAGRIRRASADVLAGASLGSIVTAWNRAGFTTGTGRTWNYATLRQVLTRARNAGLIELNREIVGRTPWPVIVTEDTWRGLCALLGDPSRRKSQTNRAKHLMAGIAVCGNGDCGLPLRSGTASGVRPRTVYRCTASGTGHVARTAADVDALVVGVIEARLARADIADLLTVTSAGPDLDELRAERLTLRGRLAELADEFADDDAMTSSMLRRITDRIGGRITEIDSTLGAAASGSVLAGIVDARDPVKAWRAAGLDRQRAIVRQLISVVVLRSGKSGNVFDPDLVQIEWIIPR